MLTQSEVEQTTADVLGWIEACQNVLNSIPEPHEFDALEAHYSLDPVSIDNAFWAGRRLLCFPCSDQNLPDATDLDTDWTPGPHLSQRALDCLQMMGQYGAIEPAVLDDAVCALYWCSESLYALSSHRYYAALEPEFRDLVRDFSQKEAGQRYVAYCAFEHEIRPFITGHEVAEWWAWQMGMYLQYCWYGPDQSYWWTYSVGDFISQARENADTMRDCLTNSVNVPMLQEVVKKEGLQAASHVSNRVVPSVPGNSKNEWITDPVDGVDLAGSLRMFEDPDVNHAPKVLGLSTATGISVVDPNRKTEVAVESATDEHQGTDPVDEAAGQRTETPPSWRELRDRKGQTVAEQLTAIYLNDERCRGLTSTALAGILECSARHIRRLTAYKTATADAELKRRTGQI